MTRFTYRSARSGSLMIGLGLVLVIETTVMHVWLHPRHPLIAWSLTVLSLMTIAWLAADYHRLGTNAIVVDDHALHLRVGARAHATIPVEDIAQTLRPTWKDLPSPGDADAKSYRNLTKPAPPNVMLVLRNPIPITLVGGVRLPVQRIGLHLDDPDGFMAAIAEYLSEGVA